MARLTSPTGATVEVSDAKAEVLLGRGFTAATAEPVKAPAKKAAKKSSK